MAAPVFTTAAELAATLESAPPEPGCELCVHAWIVSEEGDSTYAEPDTAGAFGTVYLRTPTNAGGEFDEAFDVDFPTLEAAESFAAQYSDRHGLPVMSY